MGVGLNTVALIQARMSSKRFPGKVLESINGLEAIVFMVRRVMRASMLSKVAVVTSVEESDDALTEVLQSRGILVYRGSLNDVLDRFLSAARHFEADRIVRLTGDCPLLDPDILDSVVSLMDQPGIDYASNIEPPSFPDGLDCECFSMDALAAADRQGLSASDREHVTQWMRSTDSIRRKNYASIVDASQMRLTLDYPEDLEAIRQLVSVMPNADNFDYFDMLRALTKNPQIAEINPYERA